MWTLVLSQKGKVIEPAREWNFPGAGPSGTTRLPYDDEYYLPVWKDPFQLSDLRKVSCAQTCTDKFFPELKDGNPSTLATAGALNMIYMRGCMPISLALFASLVSDDPPLALFKECQSARLYCDAEYFKCKSDKGEEELYVIYASIFEKPAKGAGLMWRFGRHKVSEVRPSHSVTLCIEDPAVDRQ